MFANLMYVLALATLSPIVVYRSIRHGRYRRGIGQKLLGLSRQSSLHLHDNNPCIWIHAVSVGEVNLLGGIVKRLESSDPNTRVVISTSTDTGYDLAIERFGAERVFFCPLDFTWAVKRTLRHLRPSKLLLAELELWPNLVRLASQVGCPVYVFNARLSERSATRYQQCSVLTRPTFARLHWVGCQDPTTAEWFAQCGTPADRLCVTGSLKFDGAPDSRDTPEIDERVQWCGRDPWHRIWLFGSTQAGEESMAINIYHRLRKRYPELRLIIVPRHRERFDQVAQLIQSEGLRVHRRSTDKSLFDSTWESETVILIDSIGELRHWWGVCQIATVGGSFGDRGGQNMLEPAGYGCATSFGPNTKNFAQIADALLIADAAVRVTDSTELFEFVQRCITDGAAADALGRNARAVVKANLGATDATILGIQGFDTKRSARAAA